MDHSNIKVLVVDDEDGVRRSLAAFLEDESFLVRESDSGEEAIRLLQNETFNIGIIDMRLPGIDGNSLILKAHELQPEMKFLIHTGSTNYLLPQSLMKVGIANEHILRKPLLDMRIVAKSIYKLFGRKWR